MPLLTADYSPIEGTVMSPAPQLPPLEATPPAPLEAPPPMLPPAATTMPLPSPRMAEMLPRGPHVYFPAQTMPIELPPTPLMPTLYSMPVGMAFHPAVAGRVAGGVVEARRQALAEQQHHMNMLSMAWNIYGQVHNMRLNEERLQIEKQREGRETEAHIMNMELMRLQKESTELTIRKQKEDLRKTEVEVDQYIQEVQRMAKFREPMTRASNNFKRSLSNYFNAFVRYLESNRPEDFDAMQKAREEALRAFGEVVDIANEAQVPIPDDIAKRLESLMGAWAMRGAITGFWGGVQSDIIDDMFRSLFSGPSRLPPGVATGRGLLEAEVRPYAQR